LLAIGDPFFERHGSKAVFFGRWIAGLRIWASWARGGEHDALAHVSCCGTRSAASAGRRASRLPAYFGGKGRRDRDQQIGILCADRRGGFSSLPACLSSGRRRRGVAHRP